MERKICEQVICPECKYFNKKYWVDKYGTCNRCHTILNKKAKFNYEMVCKLRLWRKKKSPFASYKSDVKM